jgi:hypothetical protein
MQRSPHTRRAPLVLGSALIIGVLAAPLAGATGEGSAIELGERNPFAGSAKRETQVIANTDTNTYGTRQSNLGKGGGAIYGCRTSGTGLSSDPKTNTACVRVNNLRTGQAFQFQSLSGALIGVIQSGPVFATPNPNAKPFITNATGVADGLNADKLDGKDADAIIAEARQANPAGAAPSFAFGQIAANADVEASRSQGITNDNVDKGTAAGVYCFKGLTSRPKNAQATLVTGPGEIAVDTLGDIAECPGNEQLSVRTYSSSGGAEDKAFQITLTGGGA